MNPGNLKVFITAGEASGDTLGAGLMRALKEKTAARVNFEGVGGPQMEAQGLRSLFPMQDLSVMGVAEVLPRLNLILKRIRQTARRIEDENPDIVVTIDSPDFSFRVARLIKNPSVMIHYVAPTVWAWRPGRAKKVADLYDGIVCLLPFEPLYFEAEGMKAVFTGHPMLESGFERADGEGLRARLGIAPEQKVLGVLFGSRGGELRRTGYVLREAALKIVQKNPDMQLVTLTLPHLKSRIDTLLEGFPCKTHVLTDAASKWSAFAAMDVAMATSGTVGLELAVTGVPHVIAYKINALTHFLIRSRIKAKYAHLANILLDREVVPEFIQKNCTADAIAGAVEKILRGEKTQRAELEKVRGLLQRVGTTSPSLQAADFILSFQPYFRFSTGM